MKFDSKDVALAATFAALYAVLVIVQGTSAAATIQLRIADVLIPLSALFGWPVVFGVTSGCIICNTYTSASLPYGVYDVAFGPMANFVAATLIYLLRNRRLIGCLAGSLIIGSVVGSYIWMIFGATSEIFGLKLPSNWPVFAVSMVSVTISSLIAIALIGYILLTTLGRPSITEPLKSKGLKVYT